MTRINCISPAELTQRHLIAEYRELPRVFALVRKAIARGERPDDPRNPEEYTLGRGHLRFFYPRLGYLLARQALLIAEMKARGFRAQYSSVDELSCGISEPWLGAWKPTQSAITLNRARIALRLNKLPEAHT
jgi:deoxyribonuclease (pyrimidine dimer)